MSNILSNPMSSVTAINVECLRLFGASYYNYDPETIRLDLPGLPEINYDKINAVSVIVTSDNFYETFEAFEKIGHVLNLNTPMFGYLNPLSFLQCCWAVYEADLNDAEKNTYSEEVRRYIQTIAKKEGIGFIPNILKLTGLTPTEPKDRYDLELKVELDHYLKTRKGLIEKELSLSRSLPDPLV